jgi:hypothetical protein
MDLESHREENHKNGFEYIHLESILKLNTNADIYIDAK